MCYELSSFSSYDLFLPEIRQPFLNAVRLICCQYLASLVRMVGSVISIVMFSMLALPFRSIKILSAPVCSLKQIGK